MTEIIKLSCKKGKIISLDGDMDDRSYSYLSQFGKSINIKNNMKFVNKTITIIENGPIDLICDALDQGKKLFIPCMNMTYATNLEYILTEKYKGTKQIKLYSSNSDDENKEK